MSNDLISRMTLYEKTAEWEAQALHMVELHLHDDDKAEWRKWSTVLAERSAFKYDVAAAPAVNAKPVVKGEWKCVQRVYPNYGLWNKWQCSECGYVRTAGWEYTTDGKRPNAYFCENCGADMREEVNNDA